MIRVLVLSAMVVIVTSAKVDTSALNTRSGPRVVAKNATLERPNSKVANLTTETVSVTKTLPKVTTIKPVPKVTTVKSAPKVTVNTAIPKVTVTTAIPKVTTDSGMKQMQAITNVTFSPLAAESVTTVEPSTIVPISTSIKPEVNPINTKIAMYTRRNPTIGHTFLPGELVTIETATKFKADAPIRVIIHGSFDGMDYGHWMRDMKSRFLDVEDSNVIIVDWSAAAGKNNANQRLITSRVVGHQIARILEDLMDKKGAKADNVHIIAHGDGTFAADVIGQRIKGIGRISGLNPSGPNFDQLPINERLDRSDATFVDIVHTDDYKESITPYKRGTSMALGDVDFYPNGGITQPGCSIDDLDDLFRKMISEGLRTFLSCSHYRAIDFYLESINDNSKCLHMGYECNSYADFLRGVCGHCNDDTHLCSEMGFRSSLYFNKLVKSSRQEPIKLYYDTARKKPYCLYHYNVQVNIAPEPNQIRGGLLRLNVKGENDAMDVKIYGGSESFKAGYTTGLIATHTKDLGPVKYVTVNWVPNSVMTLLYGENLYLEDVRVAQIGWDQSKLRTDEVSTLCPLQKLGLVTPFYGDTVFSRNDNCTMKYEKQNAATTERQSVQKVFHHVL